ncbi:MAG: YhdP family protein [Woeseiaceae bacterium]|nr:YhdP family protein [Woeseiaceae bacterium]
MKQILQAIAKFLAYVAAGIVILLAIAVGLFRLFLPRLPEYQEDIKDWASAAIGMRVEFSGMDARWGLSGPEVEFYNAELLHADTMTRIVNAEEVSIGVGFLRLVMDRKLVVDRVVIRDTILEVRQHEDGQWRFQGNTLDELLPKRGPQRPNVGDFEILGEDIVLYYLQPDAERPRVFAVDRASVRRDDGRLEIDADIILPADLGRQATMLASRVGTASGEGRRWDVRVEVDDLLLDGVAALGLPRISVLAGGRGDVDFGMAWVGGTLRSAVAELALREVQAGAAPPFAIEGTFEYERGTDGWLVAASDYALRTEQGAWPASTLSIEAGTDAEGRIAMLDVRASYLRLDDARLALPWLDRDRAGLVERYAASGEIRDLELTLAGMDTDTLHYDVAATLNAAGFAAVDERPGIRGFTGTLRADRAGGRLELDAPGLAITYPRFLGQTAVLDEASGTLIWRRSNNRTTLLSDSIVLENADFAVSTNIEVTLADDSNAPIVDLAASWSINDLATAKRYIPFIPRIPNTSAWFQEGILAGRIPRGSARLYGPMDKWPFDGGEGRFYIEAHIEDAEIRYLKRWPTAEIIEAVLAVENMRLFTEKNRLVTAGNAVNDANFELTDFRNPVINLETYSTGPIDSVRQLLAQSPLGQDVFGGRLDDLALEGDGAFSLDLSVPIRDTDALRFTTRLQTSGARLALDGFPAPLTDLSGIITVEKEDIASEGLGGTFLGRPVAIELAPAPEELPMYRIVASAAGTATAEALVEELGIPLGGRLSGSTPYAARLLFPRGRGEVPTPFAVEIDAPLTDLGVDLPAPAGKAAEAALPIAARIEFPPGEERIVTRGTAEGLLAWTLAFEKPGAGWDLDRGVVRLAEAPAPVEEPAETRGLHIRGATPLIRFDEWLALSREGGGGGIGERVRSLDLEVGSLFILGQHLVDHQYRVDRSAFDWQVAVEGPDVAGAVIVPYDFQSGRDLVLDMERLVLPGDGKSPPGEDREEADPRALPTIVVTAGEFAIDGRHLGAVEATFRHTADGLQSETIVASDPSFGITGRGGWVIDESDPRGSRSYVEAELKSTNVEETMQRLDYDPGIVSDELSMQLDLSWSGGPREDFLDSLDGNVTVEIGTGQLDEVEPGAGRMFGLLSIVALPRRLSLDFRDVFQKGFGFDRISGTFQLEDGVAATCDLSLEGPAANIGIVGRASLLDRDYEQAAVVSANFGNTLPVVGGVLGGPQVAAVMLVFSQLFKKPLQEATEIYYQIEGSWDEPLIERSAADVFARTVADTNCIDRAG